MIRLKFKIDGDRRELVTTSDDILTKDITWPTENQKAEARQYDKGLRQALVTIVNEDDTPYDLTGMNYIFEGVTPDGIHRIYDEKHGVALNPPGGQFRFDFPQQVFAIAGSYKQSFFRLERDGFNVSTLEFPFDILKDAVISGLPSEDYISPVEDIIDQLMKLYDAGTQKVDDVINLWTKKLNDMFINLNSQGSDVNTLVETVKASLSDLETQIKSDGLLKQSDLDAALKSINDEYTALDAQIKNDLDYKPLHEGLVNDYNVPGVVNDLTNFSNTIASDSAFKILMLTDVHYGKGTNDSGTFVTYPYEDYVDAPPLAIQQLSNMKLLDGNVNVAVLNGDNAHGHEGREINTIRNKQVLNTAHAALANTDLFVSIGNHDDGSVWSKTKDTAISKREMLAMYDYKEYSFGETRKDFAAYKDYPDQKIRVISIAGFDNPELYDTNGNIKYTRGAFSVFTQDQLAFIKTALAAPDDYHVVIFNHAPLMGYFGNTTEGASVNHDLLEGMLQAFVNKTTFSGTGTNEDYPANISVDYSKSAASFVGIIFGHQHRDREMTEFDGVKAIERTCFLGADRGDSTWPTMTMQSDIGTEKQYAFDVIEIDTANRKVTFKRFGMGSDYSYGY